MAGSGFVVMWGQVKLGRERMAGELFASTMAHYQKKVKDGTFESFEPVFLANHAGSPNGFFLVRGETPKLDAYRLTDEFKDWSVQAVHCLEGFGVVPVYLGDKISDIMTRWNKAIPE